MKVYLRNGTLILCRQLVLRSHANQGTGSYRSDLHIGQLHDYYPGASELKFGASETNWGPQVIMLPQIVWGKTLAQSMHSFNHLLLKREVEGCSSGGILQRYWIISGTQLKDHSRTVAQTSLFSVLQHSKRTKVLWNFSFLRVTNLVCMVSNIPELANPVVIQRKGCHEAPLTEYTYQQSNC